MKLFLTWLFIIATIFIAGCGRQDGAGVSESKGAAESYKVNLQPKISYAYYKDGSCTPSDTKVCINFEEYKELCSRSAGITRDAGATLSIFDAGARSLFDAGGVDGTSVAWNPNSKTQCRATVILSGVYMGNSARREMEGGATTFILSKSGEVLVSSASTINY